LAECWQLPSSVLTPEALAKRAMNCLAKIQFKAGTFGSFLVRVIVDLCYHSAPFPDKWLLVWFFVSISSLPN